MRVVALEEHVMVESAYKKHFGTDQVWLSPEMQSRLTDTGQGRLKDMDDSGITVQVLSATIPGAEMLDGQLGIDFAREVNDSLKESVRNRPGRFAAFAHLPVRTPEAAADELERCVRDLGFCGGMIAGTVDGRFLDDPRFGPLLARFEALDVPLYMHPNLPPKAVHDAYYSGLPGRTGSFLESGVMGWHAELGIHIFRLVFSGTFDRHPKLKIIIGHLGEFLPFTLDRADRSVLEHGGFDRRPSTIITKHVWITTSGCFAYPPFLNALLTFGADRILFSVDYPYSANASGRTFLDNLPVSEDDKAKICHGNADRLLNLSAG